MARSRIAEGRRSQTQRTARAESWLQHQFSHDAIISGAEAGLVKRAIEAKLLRLDEVHRLIPASTFARKVREGRKLSHEEADQGARLLRIKGYAAEVFEDARLAESWLSEANPPERRDLRARDLGSFRPDAQGEISRPASVPLLLLISADRGRRADGRAEPGH